MENNYRDFAGFDMTPYEFSNLGVKAWEEDFSYLFIDRAKKARMKENKPSTTKAKTFILNAPLRANAFRGSVWRNLRRPSIR